MRVETFGTGRAFLYACVLGLLLLMTAGPAPRVRAQKLPPILQTGSGDPSAFNLDDIRRLKADYDAKSVSADAATREEARQLRNRLIGIGRDQVDAMFYAELRSDRRRIRLVQFILDFLEIGAATAIGITNGERAKTVISEGLGALQASRTSLNRNFRLLERQVIINKMEADRAGILTGILGQRNADVGLYSWEDARADLRNYRNAGTLDGALASLSASVGNERLEAEAKLREVKDQPMTSAATPEDLTLATNAAAVRSRLEGELADDAKKDAALKTLQKIVAKLAEDKEIAPLLESNGIAATDTDAADIIAGIADVRADALALNRRDLVRRINAVIIEIGNQQ